MYVSIGFTVGSLALLQGVASHSLFGHRGVIVSRREPNSTVIVSEPENPSTISPPCTTTVTSILGERFAPRMGSCSHTFTITSTIQPTESASQPAASETSSSVTSTSKTIPTSPAGASPTTASDSSSFTTASTKADETPAQNSPPPAPLTSSIRVNCITTVTSILGQFLVLGTGSCSQTVTIISTIKEVVVPEPTSSSSRTMDSTSSAREIQTPVFPFPTNLSPLTPIGVGISSTPASTSVIPLPKPCTATVTSILGKPFVPLPELCSHTITVVTSAVQASEPQPLLTSKEQPPVPTNTGIGPSTPPTEPISTSTTFNPVPPPQQTESNSPDAGPVIVITMPGTTSSIPTATEQVPQPTPETTTSQVPVDPIPATTTQIPQLPNPPPTSLSAIPIEITTSPLSFSGALPTTQEPQPVPNTSRQPAPPVCATECTESQPTTQPAIVSTVSPDLPIQTPIATETQAVPQNSEQGPTITQGSGIPSTDGVSTSAPMPSPPIPTITNTPTPGAIIIGSQTISQDTASNFIFGSQTLVPGSAITVNGQQVSAAASGGAIILNPAPAKSTPSPSAGSTTGPAPVAVVVDGTSITGNTASGFVIGTQTLFPGSAITASGQVITLPSPNATPAPAPTQTQGPETVPVILIGSSTFTQNSASAFIIGSQTLSPGSAVTISGQVISLSPTGNAVIVNGATATRNPTTFSTEIQAPVTSLVVAGQTLTAGGRVTVGGDVLSLAGGAITVIGTVTVGGGEATAMATPTGKKSLGGKVEVNSRVYMALQISFVFGLGAFGLF